MKVQVWYNVNRETYANGGSVESIETSEVVEGSFFKEDKTGLTIYVSYRPPQGGPKVNLIKKSFRKFNRYERLGHEVN